MKPTNSSCQGEAVEESGGQTEVLWLALQRPRTSLSTFLALNIIIAKDNEQPQLPTPPSSFYDILNSDLMTSDINIIRMEYFLMI